MTAASQTTGEPAELEALLALARREHRAGRLAEAAEVYFKIVALRPDVAEAHNELGIILAQQGKLDEALARFQQVIALRPDHGEAHSNLANVLLRQSKPGEAAAHYEKSLALNPANAEAHNNLGSIFWKQGRLDEAAARFEQSLALRPANAEAHNNLGSIRWKQGKLDEAAAHYMRALALRPDLAEAHSNLGAVLRNQGKLDQALARFEQALVLRPDYAGAHNNLGNVLRDQGKLDEAAARYEQALALRPDFPDAIKNLAVTLREQLKLTEARQVFQRLHALQPDGPDAQLGLATCYLVEEDYERGWPAFEARLRMPGFVPPRSLPRWKGESLVGRSLLLLAEQGFGDTFQFIRYTRPLKERGARIVLACPKALGRLLVSHPDLDELFILGSGEALPRSDFYLPLLSAPGALGTNASTIPCEIPYITADAELTDRWHEELSGIDGFKIGIAWQGSRDYLADRWRSIPLAQFAPLARLPGMRLVSLQKGFGSEQVAAFDFPVLDLSSRLDGVTGPFMDTAAMIRGLDLVVTSDTSIAHLAGALGVPVWVALPFAPDWRWLLGRDDSPWYPTMRLFRQTTFGGWPAVFERIANAVRTRRSETA